MMDINDDDDLTNDQPFSDITEAELNEMVDYLQANQPSPSNETNVSVEIEPESEQGSPQPKGKGKGKGKGKAKKAKTPKKPNDKAYTPKNPVEGGSFL